MEQLLLHLIGDYITQSHWMAENKTKRSWPAFLHAMIYSIPFWLLTDSYIALLVIFGTHFLIDRFRLTRYIVWYKNLWLQPKPHKDSSHTYSMSIKRDQEIKAWLHTWSWKNCQGTGYPSEVPAWLSVWLMIIADNILHLSINYAAIRWL